MLSYRRVVAGTDSWTEIHRAAPSPFLLYITVPRQRRVPPSLFLPPLSVISETRDCMCYYRGYEGLETEQTHVS